MAHVQELPDGVQPKQASAFRKGDVMLIKNFPCRIVDMSTSKTGKHGHAKVNFTALDIFTNKKLTAMESSTHNCSEVIVTRTTYMVTDIDHDDNLVNCLDEDNNPDSFSMPSDEDLAESITTSLEAVESGEESRDLYVNVIKALGKDQIMSIEWKTAK